MGNPLAGAVGAGADRGERSVGIRNNATASSASRGITGPVFQQPALPIERLPLGYIVVDKDDRVCEWNRAAERIFGYTREEILGKDGNTLIVSGPVCDAVHKILRRIRAGDMDAHSVNENRTKYGRIITCEWFNTPLFDENGNFAGAVSLAQDVTERERTAREVESSRRRLRALNAALENAVEGIARLDTDGTYVSANHAYAAMFGYQPEELLGRPWHQTVYYDDVKKLADAHLRMLSNRRVELEVRGRRKDGSVFWKHVVVLKAKDEKGEWTGSYCFTDDITQRKFAEEVLQAYAHRLHDISHRVVANQEAERRHLAQELHDEVGQVLSAISVNLQSIAPICDASAQSRLHESVQIVNQAIQQVRSLSFDLSPAMLDTLGLVATLRWCANRQAQRTGFTLHFNAYCSGHRRPSAADIACYRVAQESLTNIVRHAKAKNVWVVFSESEDEYIELVVRDDGVGFDVAELCRRVARGASFGVQGMQERVELMGGEFAIDSTPNGGTSVTARFPARPRITDEFPMGGTGDETNSGAVGRRP